MNNNLQSARELGGAVRRPLCFVLMPFHKMRSETDDRLVDFDAIYGDLIEPAVYDAGLRPHRADEETLGGIFHRPMFERLILCEYAVADLSMANPNVFYELGVRHAIRPWSTVLMFRSDAPLPLDVAFAAGLGYPPDIVDRPDELRHLREMLTRRMLRAQDRQVDSPVHQLVTGLPVPELDHRRVDLILEAIDREAALNRKISQARTEGRGSLQKLRESLGDITQQASESVVALLLAFRSVNAWEDMTTLVDEMAPELAEVTLVREQYALALGRVGEFRRAAEILKDLLKTRPNAETFGLLGGVYKREWQRAVEAGSSEALLTGLLIRAAETYKKGFEHDFRDPYPGVNAVALLSMAGRDLEVSELAPVVRYCVNRRLKDPDPEYWDFASALQLAIVRRDFAEAHRILPDLLTAMQDRFEGSSTSEGLGVLARALPDESDRLSVRDLQSAIDARRTEL